MRRREATLTLRAPQRLARSERSALEREAERLVRALHPGVVAHGVRFEREIS